MWVGVCMCVCRGSGSDKGSIIRLHFTLPDNPSALSEARSAAADWSLAAGLSLVNWLAATSLITLLIP